MQVRLIRNPISGSGGVGTLVAELARRIAAGGGYLDVCETEAPGDASRLAALTPPDTRAVICAGGDGTLREVVSGMIGKRVPILVLPTGTENVLAKHFGYRRNVAAILDTLERGCEEAYDVGVCGQRKFILLAGVGFDGDVVKRLHEARRGNITHLTWAVPLLEGFIAHPYPEVSVAVDGREVFCGRGLVFVGNIARYSLGMRVLDQARTDDGLLDVRVLPCRTRRELVGYGLRMLLHRPIRRQDALYLQGHTVRVWSARGETVPVQIDGDYGGSLPIECSVIAGAVRFLRPA
ncbi:MAG TPA: diacylglycerol kinase family protein [Phycisphaerae bacterium]|nr:diacylglycerol kinase family protein [Phycisphaerae bacterium]